MGENLNNSKYKMKAKEFLLEHVQYYNGTDIADGIIDVQVITLQGKSYVELVSTEDEDGDFLIMDEIEALLLGVPDNLYVVMIDPNGWSGEHEYVSGSSGGSDEITYHCSDD